MTNSELSNADPWGLPVEEGTTEIPDDKSVDELVDDADGVNGDGLDADGVDDDGLDAVEASPDPQFDAESALGSPIQDVEPDAAKVAPEPTTSIDDWLVEPGELRAEETPVYAPSSDQPGDSDESSTDFGALDADLDALSDQLATAMPAPVADQDSEELIHQADPDGMREELSNKVSAWNERSDDADGQAEVEEPAVGSTEPAPDADYATDHSGGGTNFWGDPIEASEPVVEVPAPDAIHEPAEVNDAPSRADDELDPDSPDEEAGPSGFTFSKMLEAAQTVFGDEQPQTPNMEDDLPDELPSWVVDDAPLFGTGDEPTDTPAPDSPADTVDSALDLDGIAVPDLEDADPFAVSTPSGDVADDDVVESIPEVGTIDETAFVDEDRSLEALADDLIAAEAQESATPFESSPVEADSPGDAAAHDDAAVPEAAIHEDAPSREAAFPQDQVASRDDVPRDAEEEPDDGSEGSGSFSPPRGALAAAAAFFRRGDEETADADVVETNADADAAVEENGRDDEQVDSSFGALASLTQDLDAGDELDTTSDELDTTDDLFGGPSSIGDAADELSDNLGETLEIEDVGELSAIVEALDQEFDENADLGGPIDEAPVPAELAEEILELDSPAEEKFDLDETTAESDGIVEESFESAQKIDETAGFGEIPEETVEFAESVGEIVDVDESADGSLADALAEATETIAPDDSEDGEGSDVGSWVKDDVPELADSPDNSLSGLDEDLDVAESAVADFAAELESAAQDFEGDTSDDDTVSDPQTWDDENQIGRPDDSTELGADEVDDPTSATDEAAVTIGVGDDTADTGGADIAESLVDIEEPEDVNTIETTDQPDDPWGAPALEGDPIDIPAAPPSGLDTAVGDHPVPSVYQELGELPPALPIEVDESLPTTPEDTSEATGEVATDDPEDEIEAPVTPTPDDETWGSKWAESAQGWVEDASGESVWRTIVTTADTLSTWSVDTYLGMATGDSPLIAGDITIGLAAAREQAIAEMVAEALARGAHAVIAVNVGVTTVGDQSMATATGTAVTLGTDA